MPLQLAIVSDHKELLGDDRVREFRENGGTIGRSFDNDWILPDPDRLLSGKHATVDFQSGAYYLADVSTNGVFVNGESEPLGRDNPRRLFNGDKLRMGGFLFDVSLDEGNELTVPLAESTIVAPDAFEPLVAEDSCRSGAELPAAEEVVADEDSRSALFGESVKQKTPDKNNGKIDTQANPFSQAPTHADVERVDLEMVLDAFMRGLEISRADIDSSADPLEVMENAGRTLKAFVDGTSDLLARRASLKSMFRLNQTTMLPHENNPLKVAEDSRDSLMRLLIGKEDKFIGPVDAIQEVYQDLKFHHDAVLEGMMAAFVEFVGRFDPEDLQHNFDRTLDKKPLFSALNQLKYWQLYRDLYPIMTQKSIGAFPQQFGDDFVRSYQKLIADFARGEPAVDSKKAPAIPQQAPVEYDKDNLVDQTEDESYESKA